MRIAVERGVDGTAVETVTEAMVSIQRIERFLNLPEPSDLPAANDETARVVFRGGTFEWDADAAAAVDDDGPAERKAEGGGGSGFQLRLGHFSVEEGELIGICGPVRTRTSDMYTAFACKPCSHVSKAPTPKLPTERRVCIAILLTGWLTPLLSDQLPESPCRDNRVGGCEGSRRDLSVGMDNCWDADRLP